MKPVTARLAFAGFVLLAFAITVNALLLQPAGLKPAAPAATPAQPKKIRPKPKSISDLLESKIPAAQEPARQEAATTDETASRDKLNAAIERELRRKGYASQIENAGTALKAMILAYEFDSGLPLTGAPKDEILKRLLFDLNLAPRGAFADRAEADQRLVLQVQKTLVGLGFFSGALTGRMDAWTQEAISAFERHRKLPQTGRLNEETLLDLIAYTGQPIDRSRARN